MQSPTPPGPSSPARRWRRRRIGAAALLLIGALVMSLPFRAEVVASQTTGCGAPLAMAFKSRDGGHRDEDDDPFEDAVIIEGTDVGPFPRAFFCQGGAHVRVAVGTGIALCAVPVAFIRRRDRPAL